jgi:hypothetical protein
MSRNRENIEKLRESSSTKQDVLISGENIKTINGQSLLGSGNVGLNVIYIQEDEPVLAVGQKALWIQKFPDGTFDIIVLEN